LLALSVHYDAAGRAFLLYRKIDEEVLFQIYFRYVIIKKMVNLKLSGKIT